MSRALYLLALVLVVVGALNWGLVGLAQFDLVAALFGLEFGETNVATRIVYGLVGLAAVYALGALVWKRGRITEGRGLSTSTTH